MRLFCNISSKIQTNERETLCKILLWNTLDPDPIIWPKTWKIKCFQFIQSKISQFVTQMWLPKKLQFLVPGTPPDPPIPPLTPPGVRGSQKWPKCIPSSPIMIINAKKSHFRGVKNFDLFFHSECTCLFFHTSCCKGESVSQLLKEQTMTGLESVKDESIGRAAHAHSVQKWPGMTPICI